MAIWVFGGLGRLILAAGSANFASYGITFEAYSYVNWGATYSTDYGDLLDDIGWFAPSYFGCDVILLLTGQIDPNSLGVAYNMGEHFVVGVDEDDHWYVSNDRIFQHEASHLFGCTDSGSHPTNCIMGSNGYFYSTWCSVCKSYLSLNCGRFDKTGYVVSVTKFESGGSAYVNNKDNVVGAATNGKFAELYSGSYTNKAVITAQMSKSSVSGDLYVVCKTPSSNGANTIVSVGNQYGAWTQVKQTNLYPPNTVIWLYCGYVTDIDKVAVTAYHQYNRLLAKLIILVLSSL